MRQVAVLVAVAVVALGSGVAIGATFVGGDEELAGMSLQRDSETDGMMPRPSMVPRPTLSGSGGSQFRGPRPTAPDADDPADGGGAVLAPGQVTATAGSDGTLSVAGLGDTPLAGAYLVLVIPGQEPVTVAVAPGG